MQQPWMVVSSNVPGRRWPSGCEEGRSIRGDVAPAWKMTIHSSSLILCSESYNEPSTHWNQTGSRIGTKDIHTTTKTSSTRIGQMIASNQSCSHLPNRAIRSTTQHVQSESRKADSQTHGGSRVCNNPGWSFHPTSRDVDGRLGVKRNDQAVEM